MTRYAELRCRSCFSFLEGASHPEELVERAAALGLAALALTDRNGLYGMVRAHARAKQVGLPLVVGAEVLCEGLAAGGGEGPLVLLAMDREGYANLCRLLTLAQCGERQGAAPARRDDPKLSLCLIAARAKGLFALYPGAGGDAAERLREAFGARLALAVARHRVGGDEVRFAAARSVGRRLDIPLAVTNDVHTHCRRRQPLQDVLACIRLGTTVDKAGRRLFPNAERTLKGPDEMARLWRDFPEGLENACRIADVCRFRLDEIKGEHPLPPIGVEMTATMVSTAVPAPHADPLPAQRGEGEQATPTSTPTGSPSVRAERRAATGGPESRGESDGPERAAAMALLRRLVREGALKTFGGDPPDDVERQLARELDLVEQLGYASYFLTVWDIVRFARSRGILCQGRGSAANSAVCYVLGITAIDPVRMGFLFERFISVERGEPPDIDVDFEHERREEVLQFVYDKYGRDHAGMVCEVISYRSKSALRDVGKALGLSLAQVDRMAKLVGAYEHISSVTPALLAEAGFDVAGTTIRRMLDLARELQSFPRHLSIHVGGFVITRRPLCETVPIEPAAMRGRTVVQWDKDDLAELDLLKVDLLGLGMLTALSRSLALLDRHRPAPAVETPRPHPSSLADVPAEVPAVYDMICDADTIGVFQIESRAQMSLLPRLRPRRFYDLVISVAIIRPGPIQGGMVHPYLRRRDGLEPVRYPYPPLRLVLEKTLGVPLFQEQAMRLAVIAAGFTPGEADELRRIMTHKRSHERLAEMKERIVAGMAERRIAPADAEEIFRQLLGFAGYGFPESHAASFALLVYASAWLKRHHPAVFVCALLNSQPMGFYAPHTLLEDAKRHGVRVRPVDVAASDWDCTLEATLIGGSTPAGGALAAGPDDTPELRLGLRLVKGLPRSTADAIVAARRQRAFRSLGDLARRADLSRAWLVRLAEAGALRGLSPDRRGALWSSLALPSEGAPEGDLFAGLLPEEPEAPLPPATAAEEVIADFATTGLSDRAHPMSLLRPALGSPRRVLSARELQRMPHRAPVEVAGLVIVRQRPETASGIVFVSLEDETGIANLVVMPDVYERYRVALRGASFLLARGRVERNGKVVNVRVREVRPLSLAPATAPRPRDFR